LNSAGVDLNAIPMAAIERIKILKDGASAIYGSDAIAGIVNFITATAYQGADVSAYARSAQAGGAGTTRVTASGGHGDLARDRVHVSGTLDYLDQRGLAATARRFARTSFIPGILDATSGASFPANIEIPGVPGTFNPRNPQCSPPASFPTPTAPSQCRYDYVTAIDILPPSRRVNALGSASMAASADVKLFLDAAYSHNDFVFRVSPPPISSATTSTGAPFLLPPSSPYYPAAFVAARGGDPTQPVSVLWRADELGPRVNRTQTEQGRVVAGAEGVAGGWDFSAALQYNVSQVRDRYVEGWARESQILALLDSGIVDPFAPNTPDVVAQLRSTVLDQEVRRATGTTYGVDGKLTREYTRLPIGSLAVAFGGDWRREALEQHSADVLASGDVLGGAGNIPSISRHSRGVTAVYAEVEVAPVRAFAADLAVRHDRYTDFGSTTSPKVGVRWQPHTAILLRATWGLGFRAPTLQGLYQPPLQTNTAGVFDDPLRCPVTRSATDCGVQFNALVGGNPDLRPERSRQYAFGGVLAPSERATFAVNRGRIQIRDLIANLTDQAVFGQFGVYGATNIVRGPPDPAHPGLPGPIIAVRLPTTNFGRQDVAGTDFDVRASTTATALGRLLLKFSGTYLDRYKQSTPDGEYPDFTGARGAVGALPRWRHNAAAT
jgi:iron complex outermembrane receptor protein